MIFESEEDFLPAERILVQPAEIDLRLGKPYKRADVYWQVDGRISSLETYSAN